MGVLNQDKIPGSSGWFLRETPLQIMVHLLSLTNGLGVEPLGDTHGDVQEVTKDVGAELGFSVSDELGRLQSWDTCCKITSAVSSQRGA